MRRLPPRMSGSAPEPPPASVRNQFETMGDDAYIHGVIGDLSFVAQPGQQLLSRNTGDLCKHCFQTPDAHTTSEAAAVGYERLGPQTPGVHPDTDTARNSSDLLAESRTQAFHSSGGR